MKTQQAVTDKMAIGLSVACAIHCLALPILILMLPSITALKLDNEAFHLWMVVAVIPCSIYSLFLGCKEHNRRQLVFLTFIGLGMLLLALLLGEERIGAVGEKVMTLVGASIVALGHWRNFRLCQEREYKDCACPADEREGA